jgi:hypothetical protein
MTKQEWLKVAKLTAETPSMSLTPLFSVEDIEPHDKKAAQLWKQVVSNCQGVCESYEAYRTYLQSRLQQSSEKPKP